MEDTSIFEWDLAKLWAVLQELINDDHAIIDQQEIDFIKNGCFMAVPIHYFIHGWYETYPSSKACLIKGHGKYKLNHVLEEIDKREQLMRNIILTNQDQSPTAPRF